MSDIKITDHLTITTEHPASSYGAGVLLVDWAPDRAFGPADAFPPSAPELVKLLGAAPQSCAEIVLEALMGGCNCAKDGARAALEARIGADAVAQLTRWLSQHPAPSRWERLAD